MTTPPPYLFRQVTVIDGTGTPGKQTDVFVQCNKIQTINSSIPPSSLPHDTVIIEGKGRVLAPGFIDAHCHGDPLTEPEFVNFLAMGVTTICLGQDGKNPNEQPIGPWLDQVDQVTPGVNVLALAGHGTVRHQSGIAYDPNPTQEQIDNMRSLVKEAMEQGAFGLSLGLEYLPGLYANSEELAAIATPVGEHQGLVMSHMRSEDDPVIEQSLDELITQGRQGNCHVHVSHIKVIGGRGKQRAKDVLTLMKNARKSGVKITADIYPYTASCTTVGILFPKFAKQPNDYEIARTQQRQELADWIKAQIDFREGPHAVLFADGPFAGKTLETMARQFNITPEDFLIDEVGPDGAEAAYFDMDENLQECFLKDPHIMISSDGSPTMGHPRGYGAFARIIQYFAQQKQLFSLEKAIHKMTGLTAQTYGLTQQNRGLLKEGFWADLTLFDPVKIKEIATYEQPHLPASGFDLVMVNGAISWENQQPSPIRFGKAIRKKSNENPQTSFEAKGLE
jgi:N-acyl-D-amino-acid deacylase